MATYLELRQLFFNTDLHYKVEVAAAIGAQTILAGDDTSAPFDQAAGKHELRVKWANQALNSIESTANQLLKYVVAANSSLTVAQIQGANDNAIQSNVNEAIDELASAQFGV